jgi:tetratricopeptide (TPR) repeat protein
MDPDNPVVALCAQGMEAEGDGRAADALALFTEAWQRRTDDFEACVAAHYVARHQDTPELTLHWNRLAVDHADAAGDDRVRGFYPSLYLNLGRSYEDVGDRAEAARWYTRAGERLADLPDGGYGDLIRQGVSRALSRTADARPVDS